jgi:dimethylglycine dehydrogenase
MVQALRRRTVPMMVMSHQYLIFDEVPAVRDWSAEVGHKLPLLRDVDVSYYLRQEKNGFNLGPYERQLQGALGRPVRSRCPRISAFSFTPTRWTGCLVQIEDSMARVPVLAEAGLAKTINGPIPYAPDGNPLIGPMPGVPNAFEACVFTFGIAQGGGAGKVLAEWITEGATEWDMWSCDPRRFTDYTDHDYCVAKGMEVYGHEYGMHFPHTPGRPGADKKLSPVHDRVAALGAQFGAYNGWERANWFARPGRRHKRGGDPDLGNRGRGRHRSVLLPDPDRSEIARDPVGHHRCGFE